MPNSVPYKIKPVVLATVLVLLLSIFLSGIVPTPGDSSNKNFKKILTENLAKDSDTEQENTEENEFSEEMVSMFYADYQFSNISCLFRATKFVFIVPRISLDIPVPPPKNHTS